MAVARILTESGGYDQAFVRRWTNAPLLVRQDNGLLLRAAELGVGPATSFVVFDEIAQQPRAYDPALAVSPRNAASLALRSEEHTSELQSLMRISYAVFCLKKKKNTINTDTIYSITI